MSASDHLGQQWSVEHHESHLFSGDWATAHAPTGEMVGHMRYRTGSDPFTMEKGHTTVEYVQVDEEHRKQGVARSLYNAVHERTGEPFIHHRDDMSPSAKRTVSKLAAENPGAHKVLSFGGPHGFRVAPKPYPPRRPKR